MQIDWWTLGLQTVNFLIVIWLLSRFLYRPIRRIIEEREAADKAASDAAKDQLEEAQAVRRTYEDKTAQLAAERQEREADFHKSLEAERDRRLEAARKEAAQLLTDARAKIEEDKHQALQSLKQQIEALATDLARVALRGPCRLPETLAQVQAHLDGLAQGDLDTLKVDLQAKNAAMTVMTAHNLSDEEKAAWNACLSKYFGADVAVVFTEKAEILGGAELHFPHAALRFSVADRLKRAAQALEV